MASLARRSPSGFTLIELLIVVAIIAILAAIAVPNFLEAQMRSKVSRVKADQRSLATAMESYRVDTNRYPQGLGLVPGDLEGYIKWSLVRLTTPISYITSLPDDPMTPIDDGTSPPHFQPSFVYNLKTYQSPTTGETVMAHDFCDYLATYGNTPTYATMKLVINCGTEWLIAANGPGRINNNTWIHYIPYDPTNGTVSRGQIYRAGP